MLLVRVVWGSNPGSVKLDTVSPTAPHFSNVPLELYCPGTKLRNEPRH